MTTENSRFILVLPKDATRQEQLRRKLAEYDQRYDTFVAPELQRDTLCKRTILKKVLEDGQVNSNELLREMLDLYGEGPPIPSLRASFWSAFDVIEDYCLTGGSLVTGGSLPR